MKERMIVKLSDKKAKILRGGTALPRPIVLPPGGTQMLSYPGHGRGYGRGGKFGPINDFDSGTADA